MPAPIVFAAIAAALRALAAALLPWFRKWGLHLLAFLAGQFKTWLDSLKEWCKEELQDFFIKDNPDAEDLVDFVNLMRGKESKFQDKIQAKLAATQGTLTEKRNKALERFDQVSDRMHAKHPVIWNDAYRSQLRDKLAAQLDTAIANIVKRMDDEARVRIHQGQKIIQDSINDATNAVARAEIKRQAIEALRSPRLKGRSDTQVAGYLRTLKDGTSTHPYSLEELENEVKGRKAQGKWNPH
jgi:hypothetical protein